MPHPDVPRVPPPWRLKGDGWIFLFTFEPWFLRRGGFLPPELEGVEGFEGQLGAVLLVDYRQSPVGPYQELLFLAGRNLRWRDHTFSVTRIYVSTEASAVNGRENWGLPKQVAEFEVLPQADGSRRVIVLRDGSAEVDLTVAPGQGLPVPVSSVLAPPSWRTITQFQAGRRLVTRIGGRGVLRTARLLDFRAMPRLFPDVNQGKLVAGARLTNFQLRFSNAR